LIQVWNLETFILLNTEMNNKDLKNKIHDLLILKNDDGSYYLFGKYLITHTQGLYTLTVQDEDTETYFFNSLKNAVTWCVFANNKKYKEVKRIAELDSLMSSLDVSIAQHKKLVNNKQKHKEDRYIYLAKLYEEKLKKQQVLNEITEFVNLSKYLQTKKFSENQVK